MSFEFRQESTKTRRFSKEKWPKMSQKWLKRSLISRTWLEPKCAHPKNSPKWPFSRQKKRDEHFTVWTHRNICFCFLFKRESVFCSENLHLAFCGTLSVVNNTPYVPFGLDYLHSHHWTPWNCIRGTNSLPKKSFSNLPGKDGRAFSLVPGIHAITSFFLPP